MKKNFTSKKSAFSLIELSIVLIIIGLLIAGITGGASLIRSSELRSVMGEARGYAVADNSFFTQYDQYPGDISSRAGSISQSDGDRDGRIEYINDATTKVAEGLDAWLDLRDIGAIDTVLTIAGTPAAPTAQVPGTNIPASKVRGAGWAFDYNTNTFQNVVTITGTTDAIDTNNLYLVSGSASADASKNAATSILTATDSLSIDTKIDDGLANSGNVQAVNTSSADASACTNAYQTTPAPTAYRVVNGSARNCALTFRVDVNS